MNDDSNNEEATQTFKFLQLPLVSWHARGREILLKHRSGALATLC